MTTRRWQGQRWTLDQLLELEHTPTAQLVQFVPGNPSCTPCRNGDHKACDTGAWDEHNNPVACKCWVDRHGRLFDRPTVQQGWDDRAERDYYRHTQIGGAA